jgi:hypothetical protein
MEDRYLQSFSLQGLVLLLPAVSRGEGFTQLKPLAGLKEREYQIISIAIVDM